MVVLSQLSEASSSSSSTRDYKYDVFLSFRGLDTRRNFIDHLHKALIEANVTTFLDEEEIETGLYLKPELVSGIKASRASILVLSENYASSTWCLNELVLILDQHRTTGHIVIPIFYHVEPTNIRHQQKSFGDAMAKHKQRMEAETNEEEKNQLAQKMEIWKKALTEVAGLKGKDAKGRFESKLIEEIVKDIYHRLSLHTRSPLPLLIGRDHSIDFITSWLENQSSRTVDILTIYGMSGIGKTSLAKYVYGLHRHVFDKSSFIADIGQRCAQKIDGILDLQKQLCGDISKPSPIEVHDVSIYTSKIENAVARNKVFLVLDDINSLEQLNALLGSKDFHPGSKVIITTKDMSVIEGCALFNLEVPPRHTKRLLKGLCETESLRLLSYHAFKGNRPKKGYEEVTEELVVYCEGHPLALKILGGALHKQDVAVWEEYIEGLKEEPEFNIQKVLKMSFDSLASKNYKELFKHIACFFVEEDKKFTETVLKACGFRTLHGIKSLTDKCLLMIGPRNELKMHNLLQEMGRDMVRQESPDKPEERSRLWCHEESYNVLEQNKGKGKLQGLVLDMEKLEKVKLCGSFELKTEALSKMDNLMLLQLNYVQLNGSYKNFPQKLRWLCMHGFPLKSIPLELPMKSLVALDMSYSNLESFDMSCSNFEFFDMAYSDHHRLGNRQKLTGSSSEDKWLLKSLKILNLSFCKQLRSVGGFSELPALERLILANCIGLIEVCDSIEQCDELILIDLSYCNMLKKRPRMVVKLKKVETLLIDGWDHGNFPIEPRDMDFPETLKAAIVEAIPRDFRPAAISLPSSLLCLSLKDSNLSNDSFPMDLSSLSKLKELYLDGNPIVSLPNCVTNLPELEKLSIQKCPMLKTFRQPPRTLKCLQFEFWYSHQEVEGDGEMSVPFTSSMFSERPPWSEFVFELEGVFKIEDMAQVAEDTLRSLGWTEIEFTKNRQVEPRHLMKSRQISEFQMDYKFGIFRTMYEGIEIPNWISHRSNGSSISFTMPPSPNKLRGLNFCSVFTHQRHDEYYADLIIKICNMTKKHSWRYESYDRDRSRRWSAKCMISLSHWMFRKNEMEDGDHITIQICLREGPKGSSCIIKECGVKLVYDDGNMEDPCGLSQVVESRDWWGSLRFLDSYNVTPHPFTFMLEGYKQRRIQNFFLTYAQIRDGEGYLLHQEVLRGHGPPQGSGQQGTDP